MTEPAPTTSVTEPEHTDPCVVGTWTLDLDSYQAYIDGTLNPEFDAEAELTVIGGRVDAWFDDEIFFFAMIDLQTELWISVGDIVVEREMRGYQTGFYSAGSDGSFSLDEETNEYTYDLRVEESGFESSGEFSILGSEELTLEDMSLLFELTYTCDDEVLEFTVQFPEELRLRFDRLDPVLDPICLFVPDC